MALPKRAFAVAAAATGVAYVGSGAVHELHVAEVTAVAAAATMRLYDQAAGPVATSPIAVVQLLANGKGQYQFPKGIKFTNGLLVAAAGGDVNGAISFNNSGGALRPHFFSADTAALVSGPVQVDSVLIAEVAAAAAEAAIYDALTVTGTAFATIPLAASETAMLSFPNPVQFATGISVDEVAGAVEGVIYTL